VHPTACWLWKRSPVTDDYPEGKKNHFRDKIHWARIDLKDDDIGHLEPEDLKYQRILARQ
jgi:hypothetical protein